MPHNGIPRRNDINRNTAAEQAIREPQSDLGKLLAALSGLNTQALVGFNVASAIKQADEAVEFRSHARADG